MDLEINSKDLHYSICYVINKLQIGYEKYVSILCSKSKFKGT